MLIDQLFHIPRFLRTDFVSSEPTIPPGHRNAICHFIKNVQRELNFFTKNIQGYHTKPSSKLSASKAKVRKPISVSDGLDSEADLADTTSRVRKQIVKWQSAQNDIHLRQLKEHKHYRIELKQNTCRADAITGTIKCMMCELNIHLGVDQRSGIKLSNWIRHIKICIKQRRSQGKQQRVTNYFSSTGTDKSSLSQSLSDSMSSTEKQNDATITDDGTNEDSSEQGFQLAPPITKK